MKKYIQNNRIEVHCGHERTPYNAFTARGDATFRTIYRLQFYF